MGHPSRITDGQLEDIRAVAADPEMGYLLPGWVIRAIVDEVIAARLRRPPRRDPEPGPLPGQLELPIPEDPT